MGVKTVAAYIFAGLVCLYMVSGPICSSVLHQRFEYTIPFVFLIQGIVLSLLIAVIWQALLSEDALAQGHFFPRLIVFCLAVMVLLALCLLTFFALPTDWAKLWLMVAGAISAGVVVLSILAEIYYRATGKKYTEVLRRYQSNLDVPPRREE